MEGIEAKRNIYSKEFYTGITKKFAEYEERNATPPIEKKTPEWIYHLSKISNSEAVLNAIVLKLPKKASMDAGDRKRITLYYDDGYGGEDEYTWPYVSDGEIYYEDVGYGKVVYLLWRNVIDKNWYAVYVLSYML